MAIAGYLLAVIAFMLPIETPVSLLWMVRALVPMTNVSMLAPVDPDWTVALILWGLPNAVLYGLTGLLVADKLMNRSDGAP
jgi:hypothetical protein